MSGSTIRSSHRSTILNLFDSGNPADPDPLQAHLEFEENLSDSSQHQNDAIVHLEPEKYTPGPRA